MKECYKCKELKHTGEFYEKGNICKICKHQYNKEYREANRELANAAARDWYKRNKVRERERKQKGNYKDKEWVKGVSLKSNHGISLDEYKVMLANQGGLCAICRGTPRGKTYFCVDHCHSTGKIRGLLCFNCNTMLGQVADSIEILEAAIFYLTKSA